MSEKRKKQSLLLQVAILFFMAIIFTAMISFFLHRQDSQVDIAGRVEDVADNVAREVEFCVNEYPAHEWLIKYWYEHYEELDIEYDVEFDRDTMTATKSNLWNKRHPDIPIRYVTEDNLNNVDPIDQKLYAEIAYSWLITRVNQLKQVYDVDYLFCVLPNETFDSQFFLFSAADPGSKRGTSYQEVYILGTTVQVGPSQQSQMKKAVAERSHLAEAGEYVDYYSHIGTVDERPIMVGLTYNVSELEKTIQDRTIHYTWLAVLGQIILMTICLLLIYNFVIKPLKSVQENIRLYKETKDSAPIKGNLAKVRPHNEIGALSIDVSDLADEMDDYINKIEMITAERERIGAELALAARIQDSMLPHTFPPFPDRREFEIFASMDPAKEVGGDFYDFFFVDEDHLCVMIADVSGKGIPASLFMMASKIILDNYAKLGKSPCEILTDTNQAITANNAEEMFLTTWLGILEISTGKLTAANAGHEYPALMREGSDFEIYKDKHDFVIGGMEGLKYREYEIRLAPGDKLFVYTDGVPEATDANNEMFGTDRMIDALNRAKNETPENILASVKDSVDEFVREAQQFDDLTMLCLTYIGKHGE